MKLLTIQQKGFTLVELMISMVLILIVTAAVAQIYITSIRTSTAQRAAAGILDANVYGLQQVEKNLRMAGLGLNRASLLNNLCSGVLVTSGSVTTNCDGSLISSTADPSTEKLKGLGNLMTKANSGPTNTNSSGSPQLTIQYRAPENMVDCEGNVALGVRQAIIEDANDGLPVSVDGQVIIERYFVKDNNGTLELRCDAGRYVIEGIKAEPNVATKNQSAIILGGQPVQNLGDEGALIVSGIDDFQVRLGVQTQSGTNKGIQYMTIEDYKSSSGNPGEIVSIQLGMLIKGQVATTKQDAPTSNTYTLFGKQVSVQDGENSDYIRRVYESNVMLRNSRGTL